MVIRKKSRSRKFLGHRTRHGSHKKWRGGGSRGGRGQAGLHKHKWSYTVKYDKEHFGKKGFKIPQAIAKEIKSINLKQLDQITDKEKINVSELGYSKVLGTGRLSRPLTVEAKYFSKSAIKKIEETGGKAVKV